jgi:hypothetical protein
MKITKADSEPFQPVGTPIPQTKLMEMANIQTQNISEALNFFSDSVTRTYQKLLD